MTLGDEKLDVYRLSIGYVAWVYEKAESRSRKDELDRMAAMLSRLGGRGCQVHEDQVVYGETGEHFDPDPDSDFDLDREDKEPQAVQATLDGAPDRDYLTDVKYGCYGSIA